MMFRLSVLELVARSFVVGSLAVGLAACSESTSAPTPAPTPTPTPTPPPVVSIAAPAPLSPVAGTTSFGWPTLIVANSIKTNTTNALLYRFDISNRDDFAIVQVTETVAEGAGQTSYRPPSTTQVSTEGAFFWRVVAIDQANAVQSSPSPTVHFNYYVDTEQNRMAVQLYGGLWGSTRPTGSNGRARFGPGWGVGTRRSFDGVTFQSPPLEILRVFDLLDRGYSPDNALEWMRANGYPTVGVWYPSVAAIGFPFQYMALISGSWELVLRVGA